MSMFLVKNIPYSRLHKVSGINMRVGRSRDSQLQRAYLIKKLSMCFTSRTFLCTSSHKLEFNKSLYKFQLQVSNLYFTCELCYHKKYTCTVVLELTPKLNQEPPVQNKSICILLFYCFTVLLFYSFTVSDTSSSAQCSINHKHSTCLL